MPMVPPINTFMSDVAYIVFVHGLHENAAIENLICQISSDLSLSFHTALAFSGHVCVQNGWLWPPVAETVMQELNK